MITCTDLTRWKVTKMHFRVRQQQWCCPYPQGSGKGPGIPHTSLSCTLCWAWRDPAPKLLVWHTWQFLCTQKAPWALSQHTPAFPAVLWVQQPFLPHPQGLLVCRQLCTVLTARITGFNHKPSKHRGCSTRGIPLSKHLWGFWLRFSAGSASSALPALLGAEWRCPNCHCKPTKGSQSQPSPALELLPTAAHLTSWTHLHILYPTSAAWFAVTAEMQPREGIKPASSGPRLSSLPSPAQHWPPQGPSQTLPLPQSSHHRKIHSNTGFTFDVSTLANSDSVNIPTFKAIHKEIPLHLLCPPPLCHMTLFTQSWALLMDYTLHLFWVNTWLFPDLVIKTSPPVSLSASMFAGCSLEPRWLSSIPYLGHWENLFWLPGFIAA